MTYSGTPIQKMNPTIKSVERGQLAKQLYEQHGSLTEVSKILGVSIERVRQLIERADRYAMRPSWLEGLESRLANILLHCGFTNAEEVRTALEQRGDKIPYLGPLRREHLRAWLARKA